MATNWLVRRTVDLAHPHTANDVVNAGYIYKDDDAAHVWEVTLLRDGVPANLTGYSVRAYFIRSDESTITVPGTKSGNVVTVELNSGCYARRGLLLGVLRLEKSGEIITVSAMHVRVDLASTENIVIDTETEPDIPDLLAALDEAVANANETLSGLNNAIENKAVIYTAAQSLTDAQKAQARANADAASLQDIADLESAIARGDCYNVLSKYHGKYAGREVGVTITYQADGGISIQGTATGTSWANLYMDSTRLPDGLEPGKRYYIKYAGTKAKLIIYSYDTEGTLTNVFERTEYSDYWTAPQTMAGKGAIIRVWLASGQTFNETVYPAIYTEMPNSVLADGVIGATGNSYSLLTKYLGRYASRENGVTITYQADGGIRIQGTTTGISWANVYMDGAKLPDRLVPGRRYYISYAANKAKLIIYSYTSAGAMTNLLETTNYNGYWTAPQDLQGTGCIVRVWLAADQEYNETVYPAIYTEKPNGILAEESAGAGASCYSVLAGYRGKYLPAVNGVTVTYQNDGGIRIQGTTTAVSYANLYADALRLPEGLVPGKRYYIAYTGVKAHFIIYSYDAEGTLTRLLETTSYNDYWTAPESMAGKGAIIRLWMDSGQTINETVYPAIYTEKPNGVLAGEIANANGNLSNVVYFDRTQTIADAGKTRARENIGAASSDSVSALEGAMTRQDCYSVLAKYYGKYASREDGVTITYQDDGGIRIQGTTTGVSFANLYMDSTKLPDGLIPGKRYYITYKGDKAKFIVYSYTSGGALTNLLETTDYNGYWTAPAALEGTGAIVRVWLASGQTYDEVVYPAIYTEMPNSELTRDVPYVDSLARNAPINFIDVTDKSSVTHSGVTYDWLPNGTCYVHGTATATSYANIFISRSALPDWMDKAYTYEINCSSESVYLYVYDYTTSSPTVLGYSRQGLPKAIKIPETCTGIIIRLWIASGTTVDEIVEASMMRSGRDMDGIVAYVGNANEYTSDANDIDRNCSVFVSLANGAPDIANVPYGAGWLDTYIVSNAIRMQRLTPYEPQKNPVMIRTKTPSGWEAWVAVGQRGYVEAVDTASADETGKTDMRAAIQYALDTYHYCKLGPGAYYVSSAVRMPQGSTLEGCGESTEIRLMSGNAKVAVMMTKYCTINNLCVFGSYTDLAEADFGETSGTRHGIYYYKGSDDPWNTAYCAITNVHIRNFSGNGIYQYNTGANVEQGVFVSNVHIKNCWCGIHNYFKSEFCRYENVQITYCYIACINDGGNNSFNNCVFHAYSIGMRIDGIRNNSAHGMCSNSSFCHIGGNSGSALTLTDIVNGYVFSACQFWYNSVDITNCGGIVFSGCEFGKGIGVTDPDTGESYTGATIRIVDNNTVMFNGCVFMNDVNDVAVITATNGDKVKIDACYGSVSGKTIHLGIND